MVVVGPRLRDAPDDIASADSDVFSGFAQCLLSSAAVEDVVHGPADGEERRARVAPDGGLLAHSLDTWTLLCGFDDQTLALAGLLSTLSSGFLVVAYSNSRSQ